MGHVDRISNLPTMILHDILSRLPEKDAAETRVLSKAWAHTWSTFPMLSFRDRFLVAYRYKEGFPDKINKKKFIDYVSQTLLRYNDQTLAIKGLKIECELLKYMSKDVDLWLKLACENGVEKVDLFLFTQFNKSYVLPKCVIEAKSLTKLVLRGNIRIGLALVNHSTKLFSLKVLSLEMVLVDHERDLQHFFSCCPLIEYAYLTDCRKTYDAHTWGFKSLSICGLPKLKVADFQGIHEVYMDSSSLEDFYFYPCNLDAPFKMELDGCKHLKRLTLKSLNTIITDSWICELFLKFPILESIKFIQCRMSKMINISSCRLKVLVTPNYSNSDELNIDHHFFSFRRSSSELEVNVDIMINYWNLHRLKEFIEKNIAIFPSLSLSLPLSLIITPPNVDVVNRITVPPESPLLPRIKLLHLEVPDKEYFFSTIVSIVFSSCCPEVICVSWSSSGGSSSKEFIVLLYEKLNGRKEDNCVCSSGDTKCWWHNLKGVKVKLTCSTTLLDNVDFMTVLESLPMDGSEGNICFILEF